MTEPKAANSRNESILWEGKMENLDKGVKNTSVQTLIKCNGPVTNYISKQQQKYSNWFNNKQF